ncbi:mechanosensitive ion channel family protein [Uruburuella testudinis]|uniref:Small-conductance mechanosensitive channel n=1 Tax=Uruburuella testudinis TaxID=1282863 RepID=A0ABY4DSC1_9NEIS|nr:mechanosensitive ion channel family protein [Uruburuella testudinis]UOO81313.1 mechanosensitive ion channel family protein [Uruburuella testudinis]
MQKQETLLPATRALDTWRTHLWETLPDIISALIVLAVFYVLARLLSRAAVRVYARLFPDNKIGKLIGSLVYGLICFSGIVLALEILNLAGFITHMLAGAGIVGIIAGFAFKDIASNAFAGFLLKSQHPFEVGQWVSINNCVGTVREIGLVTTAIQTIEGQVAYVPNQLVYNGVFVNYSAPGKWRITLSAGVSYGDDLAHVQSVAAAAVKSMDCVADKDDIAVYFTEIGDSAYQFQIWFWIDFERYQHYMQAKSDVIMQLKKAFAEADIEIAYNVTTLDFGVKGGVNLFDRPVQVRQSAS